MSKSKVAMHLLRLAVALALALGSAPATAATRGTPLFDSLSVASAPPILTQGGYLQWNKVGNDGATYIVNQKGGGAVGGIKLGEADGAGGFTGTGSFLTTGAKLPFAISSGPYTPPVSGVLGSYLLDAHNTRSSDYPAGFYGPDNYVGFTGYGPYIDYCSTAGCVPGVHLRTMAYIRGRSPGLNGAQNIGLALDWVNDKGYLPFFVANSAYVNTSPSTPAATSTFKTTSGGAYIVRSPASCTSGASEPTGTGTGIVNGTCVLDYLGGSLSTGGTLISGSAVSVAGGGDQWTGTTVAEARSGYGNGNIINWEFDCTNKNKDAAAGGSFGMICVYLGGNSDFPALAGFYADNSAKNTSGKSAYHYAFLVGGDGNSPGTVALDGSFTDWSRATYSFWAVGGGTNGGRSHVATFRDDSASGTVLSATATHGNGIDFSGATFSSGTAIKVPADIAMTGGVLRLPKYSVASLPPCGSTTLGAMAIATDVAGTPAYRATGFSSGGTAAVPVFCNGSSWELH